jgi:hypothetical protein
MRRAGHIALMGQMITHRKFWSENVKERDHSKDLGINGNQY